MDFACPGLLGDLGKFKKIFSGPVERSRDKNASDEERTIGAGRSEQLGKMTEPFVNRQRADDVNGKLLPPKTEYVVFVRLTPCQAALYSAFLRMSAVKSMVVGGKGGGGGGGGGGGALTALQHLQKLCNSACLLMAPPKKVKGGQQQQQQQHQPPSTELQRIQADLRGEDKVSTHTPPQS